MSKPKQAGRAKPAGPKSKVKKVTVRGPPKRVKNEPPPAVPKTPVIEPVPERKAVAQCALCHKGIYLGETKQQLTGGDVCHPGCMRDPLPVDEAQATARAGAGVYKDFNSRTCILTKLVGTEATYVDRDPDCSYECHTTEVHKFKDRFTLAEGYPVERAARLYIGYAQNLGASTEAVAALATLVTITEKEQHMAVEKQKKPGIGTATKTAAGKKQDVKSKATAKPAKEKKVKGPSAATRFRELIMAGKHTDDQLFAIVKKEFNLDDKKRSYVAWYRNDLTKSGKKPPAAKK